jgi:hypothetical protein
MPAKDKKYVLIQISISSDLFAYPNFLWFSGIFSAFQTTPNLGQTKGSDKV